ncbi:MAG TPA: oxidoreductase [Acidimicrobiales bacterium]|jgi:NAD(P)-dependent dehydrogenase (short-subunit alcohol dehydrogenase family)|nr:oxidoreductase [Acidimicrobiales bacterium]
MTAWTTDDIPDQQGRTVLVTGANSGLGLRSAQALAKAGARVLLACRNPEKAAAALEAVEACATTAVPEVITLDLADLSSVARAADTVAIRVDKLDVLMNNAGVMAIPLQRTTDGFEMQFGTNHLGHFALTGRLLPLLLAADAPRVVSTSSQAHRTGRMRWDDLHWHRRYSKWLAYGQSKLANLLFTLELDRRAGEERSPLLAVAAHPGYAATHLQAAGPEMAGSSLMGRTMELGNRIFAQSDAEGALPQLYAATMPNVHGGEYYGPDGLFEMRGAPKKVGRIGAARDADAARRLWNVSEKETGVIYSWKPAP